MAYTKLVGSSWNLSRYLITLSTLLINGYSLIKAAIFSGCNKRWHIKNAEIYLHAEKLPLGCYMDRLLLSETTFWKLSIIMHSIFSSKLHYRDGMIECIAIAFFGIIGF